MNRVKLNEEIKRYAKKLMIEKKYVSSVDILMELNYLSKDDYEKWRQGRIEYLEKVCGANLKKLSFINKSLKLISKEMNLKTSHTIYMKYGKGKVRLRFSKTNDECTEETYSTHYV